MPHFMLLLRTPKEPTSDLSPADFDALVAKIQAWHDKLEASGAVVGHGKLTSGEGKTLRQQGLTTQVFDGPYSETKEVVGGYFLVEVPDYEAASALAEGCPVFSMGGSVEVRMIDSVYRPGITYGGVSNALVQTPEEG